MQLLVASRVVAIYRRPHLWERMALKMPARSLRSSGVLARSFATASVPSTRHCVAQTSRSLAGRQQQQRTLASSSISLHTSSSPFRSTSRLLPARCSSLISRPTAWHTRPNSTSTTSPAGRASSSASSSAATGSASSLTWDEYLSLRTKRRRINVIFSAICAMSTTVLGASFIASQDMDQLNAIPFGDPMLVLGAATAACGMAGWLLGPFMGGAVFSVLNRRVGPAMREKEKDFFNRIKRNRSDPSGQSVNNPVPDYYGEKITSVRDYRRWLKDQRAFRKKKEVNVI